jgi:plasmid stability protein
MKQTNTKFHIYCPDKTRTKLQILADLHFRSMSAEVQALIDQAFKLYLKETADKGDEKC